MKLLEQTKKCIKLVALLALCVSAAHSQGTVSITADNLSTNASIQIVGINFIWKADASGNVPATAFHQPNTIPPIGGWHLVAVEYSPGTPSPSSGYSVTVTDSRAVDLLSGSGANLSATVASSAIASPQSPPVYGAFTFTLTGNSVAGAAGTVTAYFSPFASVVSMAAASGGGGGAVSSVFGRTGAVVAASGDYSYSQISGTPTLPSFQVDGTNTTSQTLINFQDAAAFNGLTIAMTNPSAGNVKPSVSGALGNAGLANSSVSYNGVSVALGSSGTIGCAGGGVNAQTVGYTLAASDNGGLVTENGSSLTATLPNPPPSTKWCATVENLNSTALTVSRNTLQINGGTSNVTLLQYQAVTFWTDGSNYFAGVPISAGSNITLTPSSNTMAVAAASSGLTAASPYLTDGSSFYLDFPGLHTIVKPVTGNFSFFFF